jgi:hypothetical protein
MRRNSLACALLFGAGFAAPLCAGAADDPAPPVSTAAPGAPAPEARIPFADKTIWNWQVLDDRTVLIQDRGRKWYKATLIAPCFSLPSTERLAFRSNPGGTFDKFSAILVRGQRCPLISLVAATAPPKKSKAKSPDPTAAAQ